MDCEAIPGGHGSLLTAWRYLLPLHVFEPITPLGIGVLGPGSVSWSTKRSSSSKVDYLERRCPPSGGRPNNDFRVVVLEDPEQSDQGLVTTACLPHQAK